MTTLTAEQISELSAGPELDRLIHESVFGGDDPHTDNKPHLKAIPVYSTNVDAAWRIVQKLRLMLIPDKHGNWCAIQADEYESGENGDMVAVSLAPTAAKLCAIADTAPLAICRAGLLFT